MRVSNRSNGTNYVIGYASGNWLAFGDKHIILTSPDAITWSEVGKPSVSYNRSKPSDITYNNSLRKWFVADSAEGRIITIDIGSNTSSISYDCSCNIWSIESSANKIVAVGKKNSKAIALVSTNGGSSWSEYTITGLSNTLGIALVGNNWIATDGTGNYAHSIDGRIWTENEFANVNGSYSIVKLIYIPSLNTIWGLSAGSLQSGSRIYKSLAADKLVVRLQVNNPDHGSIIVNGISKSCINSCDISIPYGEVATLTAIADGGYVFDRWINCQTSSGSVCTRVMNGNKTGISAKFERLGFDFVTNINSSSNPTPLINEGFTLSSYVRNIGNSESIPTTVKYYLSKDSIISKEDILLDNETISIPKLYSRQRYTINQSINIKNAFLLANGVAIGDVWLGMCAEIKSTELDKANNCSTGVKVKLVKEKDVNLAVTQFNLQSFARAKEDSNYSVQIKNTGTDSATNVHIALSITNSQVQYNSSTISQGACNFISTNNKLVCDIGDMSKDAVIDLGVTMALLDDGEAALTIVVTEDEKDKDATDNTRSSRQLLYSDSSDFDSDGIPDAWEIEHGLDPKQSSDTQSDPDGDGVSNLAEYTNGTDPQVAAALAPLISPAGGSYFHTLDITMISSTPSARIYYTLDGTDPSINSTLYSLPFELDHSATLKAIATANGYEKSTITEVQYGIDTTYKALSQWQETQGGNCHWYGVVPANTTWNDANTQANGLTHQGVQGHLATLTSAKENSFVRNLIKSDTFDRYLIGGYQQHKEAEPNGAWTWVNNEPWIYTNWLTGEPSNTPNNEDQLDIRNYDGGWNDIPGESDYARSATGYIVEFGTGCGDSNTPNNPATLTLPETDDHGSYNLTWSVVSNTTVTHYELQEAKQADFSDATRLYAGLNTSHAITGKPAGKYYYRIRACNGSFCGTWQAAPEGLLVSGVCLDVITPAYHPETGEEKDFPTSCIPQDWIAGKAPDFDNDGINDILDEDDDNDGMSDIWEIANGLNSKDATDAESDQDSDGRSNLDEYLAGTDPRDNTSYSTLLISHNNGKTIGNSDVELSTTLYLDNTVVNTLSVSFEYGYTSSLGSVSGDVNSADIIALLLSTGNASNKTIYPAITLSGLETDKTVYYRPKLVLNGKTHLGSISKLVVAGECSYDAWEPLTANTGDPDDTVLDFAYGNGVLVATSFNSLKYSTDNGNSWTAGLSKSHFGYDVIWAGNTFFAIGVSSSSNSVYKSKNGQTWELVHEFSNYDRPSKLAWSGKQLAAAGSGGKIFLSNDGTGWEEHYVGYDGLLEDIEWINNQFEAVGANRLFSSIDGVEWNESFIEIFGGAFGMRVAGNDHSLVVHAANSSDRRIFTKLHGETNWISTTNNYFTNDYLWDGKYYFGASTTYSSSISVDGINWVDKPKLSGSTIFHDGEFIYVNGSNGVIQRSRCDAPKTADVTVKIEHTPAEFQALSLSAKILVTGNNLPSSISIETEGCSPFWSKDTRYDETTDTWTSVCGATTTGTYSGVVKNTLTGEVLADYEFELKYAEPIVTSIKTDPSVIHVGDDVLLTFTGEHLRPNSDMSLDGFENCAYTFGSYAPPAPGSNVTEIKYQCHAVSAGSKQGVINFSEELTHAFSVTVNEPIAIAPSISRITPDSIIRSTSNIEVTIEGDKFTEDSQVYFQVSGRKSKIADADVQFVDAQTLKFPVKPGLAGVWVFQVRNADKVSNSVDFTVTEPIIPVVQSITPEQANMGEITTFTVHGKDLPITLAFWIDGCANISRTNNATSTAVQFKCTPTLAGLRNGEVKTKSGGELLKQFKVNMLDELCPQVISHAYNPTTGEEKDYPTPCDVPQEWITGQAPDNDKDGTNDILDLDDDNDGLPDTWEVQYGLNSLDSNDAALDADNDNLTNLEEFNQGTSPLIANSSTNNATKVMPVILQLLLDE